jgi:hypothetical protein
MTGLGSAETCYFADFQVSEYRYRTIENVTMSR